MRVRLLQISEKNFRVQTGICENDRLQVALQKFLRDSRRFVDVIAANTQRPVDHRWIVEDKGFLRGRCAIGIEDGNPDSSRREASSPGFAMVAEQQMNCGSRP